MPIRVLDLMKFKLKQKISETMKITISVVPDELAARKFLKPKILEWFDQQISQNAMCVYLVQDTLYISLYTNRYLFPTPNRKDGNRKSFDCCRVSKTL